MNEFKNLPSIGDMFPEMEVKTTFGSANLPKDYKGKWFILFSHPADFTPVCTTEFVAFQNRYEQFKELNTELIGLSIDQVYSHIKWVEWIKDNLNVEIQFPIIADDGEVARELGITGSLHGASAFTQKTPPFPMTFEDSQYECRMLADRKLTELTKQQVKQKYEIKGKL